ncbi:MAG: hypothetical protein ACM3Q2_09130, partial [Syntrophothermus sp.]
MFRFLPLVLIILAGLTLAGCYTQLARSERHSDRTYDDRDRLYDDRDSDEAYSDGYSADQDTNYYYDNDYRGSDYWNYRPYYRRYFWGYTPGVHVGIGWGSSIYDPWWDNYGWYGGYGYYDPFYSPYYNYPLFGHLYGGYG